MLRRCSYCGHNGHNSRTCSDMKGGGFKLFGVRLSADPAAPPECSSLISTDMRKSFSMGNLYNYGASEGGSPPLAASPQEPPDVADTVEGYASDDVVHTNCSSQEKKRGIPWTEEEHRSFLIGLQKLGKGDWRGISRNFVKTRTPTQVASHAQKYFLRQSNGNKRRRRSSLFDITQDTVPDIREEPGVEDVDICPELNLGQSIPSGRSPHFNNALLLSQRPYPFGGFVMPVPQPPTSMVVSKMTELVSKTTEVTDLETTAMEEVTESRFIRRPIAVNVMEPVIEVNDDTEKGLDQLPIQFPLVNIWPLKYLGTDSKLVRPVPVAPKPLVSVSSAENLPEIIIDAYRPVMEPTPLSHKLLEEHSRHSAFHMTSPATSGRDIDGQLSNAISVP